MAITQTHKQSELEKRLKILRNQVYGKQEFKVQGKNLNNYQPRPNNSLSDITYLRQDLTKIALLSSLAFGIQIIIFYLLRNNLLSIKIF